MVGLGQSFSFRKIIDLENRTPEAMRETLRGTIRSTDSFLRMAFMTMLLDIVCDSRFVHVLVNFFFVITVMLEDYRIYLLSAFNAVSHS